MLRRASRREMQQGHRVFGAELEAHGAHARPGGRSPAATATACAAMSDPELGTRRPRRRVPGLRVVHGVAPGERDRDRGPREPALRLAPRPRRPPARGARRGGGRGAAACPPVPRDRGVPAGRRWRSSTRWDDAVADAAFAMNLDLDQPRAARRAAMEAAVAQVGPLEPDPDRPDESWSPAHAAWWLRGPARVAAGRAAHQPGAAADDPVAGAARRPDAVGDAPGRRSRARGRDRAGRARLAGRPACRRRPRHRRRPALVARRAARFGPLALGLPVEGDGTTTATWELWPADPADGDDGVATTRRPAVTPRRRSSWTRRTTDRSGRRSCTSQGARRPPSRGTG